MGDRLSVEHEPGGRRWGGPERFSDATFEVACVGEEEPVVEAVDDDTGRDDGGAVERDVAIAAEPLDPAKHGIVWTGAATDRVDHREADRDKQRLQDAE